MQTPKPKRKKVWLTDSNVNHDLPVKLQTFIYPEENHLSAKSLKINILTFSLKLLKICWTFMNIFIINSGVHILPNTWTPVDRTSVRVMFGKREIKKLGGREVKGGGAWRFMVIVKQMKTLWIASRASCQESRNQNTSLLGGSRWKKGRCEMGFKLSCFCVCTSWMVLFFTQIILYP